MVDRKSRDLMANEIAPGTCRIGTVGDKQVAIFNVDGQFYATQAECTHRGGPLCEGALWGDIVTCPWHGSEFNVRTGTVVTPPAQDPLKTYKVRVEDGKIILES
jgi:3-phenylpropionate/trans-cinnamate dioxygenase ferredoxin component